ncbi:MAG: hypothetical protein ABIR77_06095, partial [Sphingomicrobium sp.]
DAAMTIRPDDRPQSIAAWLELLEPGTAKARPATTIEIDEDATRVVSYDKAAEAIKPVAPPPQSLAKGETIETRVPDHPSEVEFKRAGHDTNTSSKAKLASAIAASKELGRSGEDGLSEAETAQVVVAKDAAPIVAAPKPVDKAKPAAPKPRVPVGDVPAKRRSGLLVGVGAAALVAAAVGGWAMFGGRSSAVPDALPATAPVAAAADGTAVTAPVETLAPGVKTLADDARTGGAPTAAVDRLAAAGEELSKQYVALQGLAAAPGNAAPARAAADALRQLAFASSADFANALEADSLARARGLTANVDRRATAPGLKSAFEALRGAAKTAAEAPDPAQSLAASREALVQWQAFMGASALAQRQQAASDRVDLAEAKAARADAIAKTPRAVAATVAAPAVAAPVAAAASPGDVSAKVRQINGIADEGRAMASQVMRRGSPDNVKLAKGYDRYLANLKSSARGISTDRDADRMIGQAKQTRAYLQYLVKQAAGAQ